MLSNERNRKLRNPPPKKRDQKKYVKVLIMIFSGLVDYWIITLLFSL